MNQQAKDARLIPWDSFRAAFVEPGIPADVPVEGDPRVTLFTDRDGRRLGLRAEVPEASLDELQLPRAVSVEARVDSFSISAEDPEMFEPFYALLLDMANRLQFSGVPPREALMGAVTAWRRMLAAPRLIGHDAQVGLLGELWVLQRLVQENGPQVFSAWTGAQREVHDFRFEDVEIEVKTTMGRKRTHLIGGMQQLTPSPNMALYLLSMHLERAGFGQGWTLGEQIQSVRLLLAEDVAASSFSAQLEDLGWLDTDIAYYPERVQLRSQPVVIEVGAEFPRLTESELRKQLGDRLDRIEDVTYRIDVEGLGFNYPSPEFLGVLPIAEPNDS